MELPALNGSSEFAADRGIKRIASAAAQHKGERHDTPEQGEFKTAIGPEQAARPMHDEGGIGHHADNERCDRAGEETCSEHEATEEFDDAGEQGERGWQAQLGGKELAGRLKAIAAKPTKELLSAMRDQKEASCHAHHGFGQRRQGLGKAIERRDKGLGLGGLGLSFVGCG